MAKVLTLTICILLGADNYWVLGIFLMLELLFYCKLLVANETRHLKIFWTFCSSFFVYHWSEWLMNFLAWLMNIILPQLLIFWWHQRSPPCYLKQHEATIWHFVVCKCDNNEEITPWPEAWSESAGSLKKNCLETYVLLQTPSILPPWLFCCFFFFLASQFFLFFFYPLCFKIPCYFFFSLFQWIGLR